MDWYNYDECILQKFSVEHESTNLSEAKHKLHTIIKERVDQVLKEFTDYAEMTTPTEKMPFSAEVNKNNRVVRRERRKIGDGSGHNFIYYDFTIIKIPAKTKVDENLFNLDNCEREVKSFFKDRYGKRREIASEKKHKFGLKDLATSKLSLTSFSWFKK
jgi:hypothetical protein